jgi:hypothetical protein
LTLLRWLIAGLGFLVRVLLIAWARLAICSSNRPWPSLRLILALGFAELQRGSSDFGVSAACARHWVFSI